MATKVRACLHFLEQGRKIRVIRDSFKLEDRSYGSKITIEYED